MRLLFSVSVIGAIASVAGSAVAPRAQPAYRAGVELVTVGVTVHHRDRRVPVGTLSAADVRVREDGTEQPVVLFEPDRRPVSLAIVLDVSTSMAGQLQELGADTARTIVSALDHDDEVSLTAFADWPLVVIPWTRVGELPGIDWAQWVLPWDTALLDAVITGLELADASTNPRRVMVVISDGFENASVRSVADLVRTRRQSEVEVYAMRVNPVVGPPGQVTHPVLSPRRAPPPGRDYFGDVVGSSGGVSYSVPSADFLQAAVLSLVSDLRNQYLVGYETRRPLDGTYRRIRVEAHSRELRIRHRAGYLALPAR